ncbi:hypothetical protein [Herbiconiux sp. L3-i23]|uniref:hypothetical protein n=1 Tax=Herbiconiux sp. L3-i23 TaxID=2905871 RepID=UPI00204DEE67|nr:hypothetical protein [Herbiconiux sp. L3-i23]BDI23948.1 hypothetical protein L3i23_27240 [Herbiconiux sp. L3-i23]
MSDSTSSNVQPIPRSAHDRAADSRASGLRAIALSALIVAVVAGAVNAGVAAAAVALGAEPTGPLMPLAYLTLTVVGAIGAAVGWFLIVRRSQRPALTLRRLVPSVLVLSWIPDIVLGFIVNTADGWLTVAALMVMHVATVAVAVGAYSWMMPPAPSTGTGSLDARER